jgi:serine/alanine adding enzyme
MIIEVVFEGTCPPLNNNAYFNDAYQNIFSQYDNAKCGFLRIEKNGHVSYLRFLSIKIGTAAYEIYSAYGYGGFWPMIDLSPDDVNKLLETLRSHRIVCAFLRHSPFLSNQNVLPAECTEINKNTYIRDLYLDDSISEFCAKANQKVRWSVKYAIRNGLDVRFTPLNECSAEQIKSFYKIYSELMLQKGDANYYLFTERLFLQHASSLTGDLAELILIDENDGEKLLAASFFLVDSNESIAHYHLSAAVDAAKKLQGMELLMAKAIVKYGNQGISKLHLGGGHSLDESDGLSRFKKKFLSRKIPFYCSKLISDVKLYEQERGRLPLVYPDYFLITDARGKAT